MPETENSASLKPLAAHETSFWKILLAHDGDGDRIRQIFGLAPVSALMNVFMSIMAALSFLDALPFGWVAAWFGLAVSISVYFVYGKYRFKPEKISRLSAGWRRFMIMMAVGISMIWVPIPISAILLLDGKNYLAAMFMTVVMMSGTVVGLSSVPIAAVISMLTVTIPILITSVIALGPLNYVLVSFLMILFVLSVFSLRHSRMVWEMEERGRQIQGSLQRLAQAHENIQLLADTDQMTGLLNRRTFLDFLNKIAQNPSDESARGHACFVVDLDHFKNINDALGHDAGDEYLKIIAKKITLKMGDDCVIARIGGDEFALASHKPVSLSEAEALCAELCAILAHQSHLLDGKMRVGGSVGCALFPQHAHTVQEWLKHADYALRLAKEAERGSHRIFTSEDRRLLGRRTLVTDQLAQAIDNGDIHTAYQPQVDLETSALVGVEALARWTKQDGTSMGPAEFFSLSEDSGRVLDLSALVFEKSIADIGTLRQHGILLPSFSINLHPAQLHHPTRLYPLVDRLAKAMGAAENVVLEITENSIIGRGAESVPQVLVALSQQGFRISLDDFGTGFASLTHLQTLPIRELKIDRNFVRDIAKEPGDQEIIRALLMIAEPRELDVVLEGVETETQKNILLSLGAKLGQGYLFAKPLSIEDLLLFAQDQQRGMGQDVVALPLSPNGPIPRAR